MGCSLPTMVESSLYCRVVEETVLVCASVCSALASRSGKAVATCKLLPSQPLALPLEALQQLLIGKRNMLVRKQMMYPGFWLLVWLVNSLVLTPQTFPLEENLFAVKLQIEGVTAVAWTCRQSPVLQLQSEQDEVVGSQVGKDVDQGAFQDIGAGDGVQRMDAMEAAWDTQQLDDQKNCSLMLRSLLVWKTKNAWLRRPLPWDPCLAWDVAEIRQQLLCHLGSACRLGVQQDTLQAGQDERLVA